MPDGSPLFWDVAALVAAYRSGELSPVEVAGEALDRIETFDAQLHSYATLTAELALEQAREAERRYRAGAATGPLLGVPTAIKDLFDVRGVPTSLGSLVYRDAVATADSRVVALLRDSGATFVGKTHTAEFGQSATTEHLLDLGCANPWDVGRTSGGSSGGSAAAVAAGLASVALGSDGGGSVRIPAAFCGLVGLKPTFGAVVDDTPFCAMTRFACPGPLGRRVADVRRFAGVLLARELVRGPAPRLKVAWCPRPEGRPVDPGVATATAGAVRALADLGHDVHEVELPLDGWRDAFGPLVLAEEWEQRRHLLAQADALTSYARRSIEAAEHVDDRQVKEALRAMEAVRERMRRLFGAFDVVVTPTTATAAFPIGDRPSQIAGEPVDSLWGPFPFTAPFNVAGTPALSLPCGLADGLPVGVQLVAAADGEELLLNLADELEEALQFAGGQMVERWDAGSPTAIRDGDVRVAREGPIAIVRISRPAKRNALSLALLEELRAAFASDVVRASAAVVLAGADDVFSAGADLAQVGHGLADLAMDEAVGAVAAAIRSAPTPVIAAVEGPCMGAAVELATACDVVVAGRSSVFALPATRLGVLYRPEALRELAGRLGHQTVARLVLLGEQLDADAAAHAGIVAHVVEAGGALQAALALAATADGSVRRATAATKALLVAVEHGQASDDLGSWEAARRALLEERARRVAVADGAPTADVQV